MRSDEGRRKRGRCLACIAAGIIAQTVIIVLFVVLVLRVKTPKVRLQSVSVSSLSTANSTSSFKASITALVTVKNSNFGHYKFDASKVVFSYKGTEVGEAPIVKDKAKAKKTKKLNVTVSLDSNKVSTSQLRSDLSAGGVTLTAAAKLNGKVHLLNIIKKKKSANLNCTVHLDTKAKTASIQSCK